MLLKYINTGILEIMCGWILCFGLQCDILYPCLTFYTQEDFTVFVSLEFEPHPNARAEQARRRQKQRHPEWCRISVINSKGGQIIYVVASSLYDT